MDFAGAITDQIEAFTGGIAGLAPIAATFSLTMIAFALILSPAAREWAAENKRYAGTVIFGLIIIGVVPQIVAAFG